MIIVIYLHGPCLLGLLHSHLHALFRTAAAGTPPLAEQFSAHTKRDIHTEKSILAFKTKLTLKPPCNIYKKHLQLKSDPLPMCIQRKLKVVNFKNISSINSGFNYWLGQTSVCNKLICSGLIFATLHQNRSQVRLHCPPGSWLEEFKLISSCTSALLE